MQKLNNEEHNDLYCSLINLRVIKSRRMTMAGMWRVEWSGEACTGFGGET